MELKASVEVQKILAKLAKLREEQAMKEAEWESTQKCHEETLCILHSQIGEAEWQKVVAEARKNDAFDSLLKMIEKAKLFDTKLKCKRTVCLLFS